jgi:hypothetical protein
MYTLLSPLINSGNNGTIFTILIWIHHHGMVHPQVVDGDGLQIWKVAVNILNKQR